MVAQRSDGEGDRSGAGTGRNNGVVAFRVWEETGRGMTWFRAVLTIPGTGEEHVLAAESLDELCELLLDEFNALEASARTSGRGDVQAHASGAS
jgi:hypothetical protein